MTTKIPKKAHEAATTRLRPKWPNCPTTRILPKSKTSPPRSTTAPTLDTPKRRRTTIKILWLVRVSFSIRGPRPRRSRCPRCNLDSHRRRSPRPKCLASESDDCPPSRRSRQSRPNQRNLILPDSRAKLPCPPKSTSRRSARSCNRKTRSNKIAREVAG